MNIKNSIHAVLTSSFPSEFPVNNKALLGITAVGEVELLQSDRRSSNSKRRQMPKTLSWELTGMDFLDYGETNLAQTASHQLKAQFTKANAIFINNVLSKYHRCL